MMPSPAVKRISRRLAAYFVVERPLSFIPTGCFWPSSPAHKTKMATLLPTVPLLLN